MQFRAAQYYQASLERLEQARRIHKDGRAFALAMYCGGLAVESLLRAFRWTEDTSFEGRHDLRELLKTSALLRIEDEYMRQRLAPEEAIQRAGRSLRAAMNEVTNLWHNNFRYASEDSIRSYLRRIGRWQRFKGDSLKKNSQDLLDAAQTVVDRGVVLWTLKKKS